MTCLAVTSDATLTLSLYRLLPRSAEIIEYSSPEETAVCNLASIALPRFVRETEPHGREGKKLVGSLDAAHRQDRAGRHPWQIVFFVLAAVRGIRTLHLLRPCTQPLMLQLHCAAACLQSSSLLPITTTNLCRAGTLILTSWQR